MQLCNLFILINAFHSVPFIATLDTRPCPHFSATSVQFTVDTTANCSSTIAINLSTSSWVQLLFPILTNNQIISITITTIFRHSSHKFTNLCPFTWICQCQLFQLFIIGFSPFCSNIENVEFSSNMFIN